MRAPVIDVWAGAGQSNLCGNNNGNLIGTAIGWTQAHARSIAAWSVDNGYRTPDWWSVAAAGAHRVGPMAGVAQAYATRPGRGCRIFKYGVGGSPIADWISTYAAVHIADMTTAGVTPAGLVWVQGEEDSKSATESAAYEARLTSLFAIYRATFPGLKVCIVKLAGSFVPLSGTAPYIADVRSAQVAYAASDALCAIVDADEYDGLQWDGVHRTGAQNLVIGARALAALEAL